MVHAQVCRSSGIALISATAAGALAGERKKRAVLEAFHSVAFTSAPFVVRTVQPVLESLEGDIEEAAASLGATRGQTFLRILLPSMWPGIVTGFALAFA